MSLIRSPAGLLGYRLSRHRLSRRLRAVVGVAAIGLTASAVVTLAGTAPARELGGPSSSPSTSTAPPAPAEPIAPIPRTVELDSKRVRLGARLFHDARLSRDHGRSCATCHPLEHGGMDGRGRAISSSGHVNARNTPTIFNVGLSAAFNWDGVASTLEDHAETALRNPNLMDITWPELLARLGAEAQYVSEFRDAYADGLTRPNVLDALAGFERSLVTPDSRFDQYLRGQREALTESERRGYALFKAYGCVVCHQGVNIGGNMFQKFGVFAQPSAEQPDGDLGRYYVTGASRDRGVFRVPSLRNVALTAPYFHDGRARSVNAAVETMAKVQLGRTLGPGETAEIVRFLQTLTGRYRGRALTSAAPPAGALLSAPR